MADLNIAAWMLQERSKITILPAPMPEPGPEEIIVKNEAIALNPVDPKIQAYSLLPLTYPTILGGSIAGIVAAIGSSVTKFKIGDRVTSSTPYYVKDDFRYGAFQKYSLTLEGSTSQIGTMPFNEAVTVPTSLGSAAVALSIVLGLKRPGRENISLPQKVLVWGGSSSIGRSAIQYAKMAGYTVISTASPAHFDDIEAIGASKVFNYKSSQISDDLKAEGPYEAIFDASGAPDSFAVIAQLFTSSGGVFASVLPDVAGVLPSHVKVKFMTYATLLFAEENSKFMKWLFNDYLQEKLLAGHYIPNKVGFRAGGLNGIQDAMDELLHGVTAQKIVLKP